MLGSVLGSVVWFPAARPAARKGFCGLWRKIKNPQVLAVSGFGVVGAHGLEPWTR